MIAVELVVKKLYALFFKWKKVRNLYMLPGSPVQRNEQKLTRGHECHHSERTPLWCCVCIIEDQSIKGEDCYAYLLLLHTPDDVSDSHPEGCVCVCLSLDVWSVHAECSELRFE